MNLFFNLLNNRNIRKLLIRYFLIDTLKIFDISSAQQSRDRQIALAKERLKSRKSSEKNKKALKTLLGFPENISRLNQIFSQISEGFQTILSFP